MSIIVVRSETERRTLEARRSTDVSLRDSVRKLEILTAHLRYSAEHHRQRWEAAKARGDQRQEEFPLLRGLQNLNAHEEWVNDGVMHAMFQALAIVDSSATCPCAFCGGLRSLSADRCEQVGGER